MALLLNLCLVGGAAYLGARVLNKRQTKDKKRWLARSDDSAKRRLLPFSTRIYVVRAWQEQSQQDEQPVTRYALTVPSTDLRYGFNNPEELLDALSKELTRTQELPSSADTSVSGVPAIAV